jgi:hypothetical protein
LQRCAQRWLLAQLLELPLPLLLPLPPMLLPPPPFLVPFRGCCSECIALHMPVEIPVCAHRSHAR